MIRLVIKTLEYDGESRRIVLKVGPDVIEAKALGRKFSRLLQLTMNGMKSVEVVNTSTGGSTFVEAQPSKPQKRVIIPPTHCINCKFYSQKRGLSNCLNPHNVRFLRASVLRRRVELCGARAIWFEAKDAK